MDCKEGSICGKEHETTIKCDGSMAYKDNTLRETMLKRVNENGASGNHNDPNYEGWYFRPWDRSEAWEYFRFTSNGNLEIHHFATDTWPSVSPFGSHHLHAYSISAVGKPCKKGNLYCDSDSLTPTNSYIHF